MSSAWAFVTGASSGIGRALALQAASRGYNVILVARRLEALESCAAACREKGVQTKTFSLDLGTKENRVELLQQCQELKVEVLLHAAGFGFTGGFWEQESTACQDMVNLNMVCVTHLTRELVQPMIKRKKGFILTVGSIAGFVSVPYFSLYAGTKAFINHFSEGLHHELRPHGIHVTCLAPGKTQTEFMATARMTGSKFLKTNVMTAKKVASKGWGGLQKNDVYVIPGMRNWLSVFCGKVCPRWVTTLTLKWLYRDLGEGRD